MEPNERVLNELSLFTGYGGTTLGLHLAGIHVKGGRNDE